MRILLALAFLGMSSIIFYLVLFKIVLPVVAYTQRMQPKGQRTADEIKAEMERVDLALELDRKRNERTKELTSTLDDIFEENRRSQRKTEMEGR